MPLPFLLGGAAAIAGAIGLGVGVFGGVKMNKANDTTKKATAHHKKNISRFERQSETTTYEMDELGEKELDIVESFERFSEILEKIQGRPQVKAYSKDGVSLPVYNPEDLKKAYVGAGLLIGGLGGAAAGAAGGFAAAGATTAAVMAFGSASTGTAIAGLSGVALTNATLATLGGGALAAGGGGMALGATVLGVATAGVALLVGGSIFAITGAKLSEKADVAWAQMKKAEKQIDGICSYLTELRKMAVKYYESISTVDRLYKLHVHKLANIVESSGKTEWATFSEEEKLITENTVLLTTLLYNMCNVQIVLESKSETKSNKVNHEEVNSSMNNAERILAEVAF